MGAVFVGGREGMGQVEGRGLGVVGRGVGVVGRGKVGTELECVYGLKSG
jgi:hypothetical protein